MLPPPFYSYVDDVSDACFFLSFLNKSKLKHSGTWKLICVLILVTKSKHKVGTVGTYNNQVHYVEYTYETYNNNQQQQQQRRRALGRLVKQSHHLPLPTT